VDSANRRRGAGCACGNGSNDTPGKKSFGIDSRSEQGDSGNYRKKNGDEDDNNDGLSLFCGKPLVKVFGFFQ